MKTIVVATLALALAALANVANAVGTGMPMMKGLKDPTVLASLVESALKRDPTGNSLLDSARCKKDGSCATAHDYFYGIQQEHPSAKMGEIAELPRYLRSLVKQPAPTGEWYMSRLLVKGEKRTYDHMAWHRAFFKGEDVWDDPNTGEHVLAGFCENVVGKLKSPVAEKETPVKVRDTAPAVVAAPPPKPPIVSASCTSGFTLFVHARSMNNLPSTLRADAKALIKVAEDRDSKRATNPNAYWGDDVSRILYDRFALLPTDSIDVSVGVQLLDPQTLKVADDLGTRQVVAGIGEIKLTKDQLSLAIQIVWPDEYVSPPVSGNLRRLIVLPREWKNDRGGKYYCLHATGLAP